jgi:DMSO/TMAO reductase YedYZ heme-binding membrane subunit
VGVGVALVSPPLSTESEVAIKSKVRARFWVETTLASLCGFLAFLTMVWRDWIEALTGFSPDHHNGSFESAIVAGLLFLCAAAGVAARVEWRQARTAA